MAIIYSGTNRSDLYPSLTTGAQVLNSVNTTLVAAGWTSVSVAAYNWLVYTANPTNNETFTIGGVVYTFKTSINNATPREILIGANADESYNNAAACIVGGPGSGSLYSSASVPSTVVSAVNEPATDRMRVTLLSPSGDAGNWTVSASDTLANAGWYYADGGTPFLTFGGFRWTSAANNVGNRIVLYGFRGDSAGSQQVRFIIENTNRNRASNVPPTSNFGAGVIAFGFRILPSTIPNVRVIANPYQMFILGEGVFSGGGSFFACGVPFIFSFLAPNTITGASNTSPIEITTSAPHGYTTGQNVYQCQVGGNTAANGNFVVTVVNSTRYTLDGSTGNGAYTSGGLAAVLDRQLAEYLWAVNQFNNAGLIRSSLSDTGGGYSVIRNGNVDTVEGSGVGNFRFAMPMTARLDGTNALAFYDGTYVVSEPLVGSGLTSSGIYTLCGQLYDSFLECEAQAGGTPGTIDGRNWLVLTNSNVGGAGNARGSFVHVVP